MSVEAIVRILREGLMLVLLLSAGPMLASMLIGLVMSILQATTQIQDQTLSFVPKLAGVSGSSHSRAVDPGPVRSSSPWFFLKRYRRCAREFHHARQPSSTFWQASDFTMTSALSSCFSG